MKATFRPVYRIRIKSAYRPFKVIQGHRFWYQLKTRMRLPISPFVVTFVLSCTVSEILQFFCTEANPNLISPEFWGCSRSTRLLI